MVKRSSRRNSRRRRSGGGLVRSGLRALGTGTRRMKEKNLDDKRRAKKTEENRAYQNQLKEHVRQEGFAETASSILREMNRERAEKKYEVRRAQEAGGSKKRSIKRSKSIGKIGGSKKRRSINRHKSRNSKRSSRKY